MIPARIHLWWNRPPAPPWVADTLCQWQDMHPRWDVHLWTDEPEVAGALGLPHPLVENTERVRHLSNVMRWHILRDHGGVWVDCDTTPLVPLDPLLEDDRPFCASMGDWPEATVIGGPSAHPLWADLLEATHWHVNTGASARSALVDVVPNYDVRVLEPGAFFDIDAAGRRVPTPIHTPRYATHRWQSSRQGSLW